MRILAVVLCALLAGAAFGEDSPTPSPTQADLDKAVRELGDDQYKVREQAFDRLYEWAIEDPSVLKKLPSSDPDPEIKNSLERLPLEVRKPGARKALYHRKLIRLLGEDAKLKEALQPLLAGATEENAVDAAQQAVSRKGDKALASALAGYLAERAMDLNETSAERALRTIIDAEANFMKADPDRDGKNFAYNLQALYATTDAAGNKIMYIDKDLASGLKEGYRFGTCTTYNAAGGNNRKYGLAYYAVPETYGKTGRKTYVVNHEGIIYYKDQGNNTAPTTWPDPANTAGWFKLGE